MTLFQQRVALAYALAGAAIITVGFIALLLSRSGTRGRDRAIAWFGTVALVYGVRLLIDSRPVAEASGLPRETWAYLSPLCSYWILAPVAVFMRALFGDGRWQLIRHVKNANVVWALVATANDLVHRSPGGTLWMNPIMVGANYLVALAEAIRQGRGVRWSREARVAVGGVVVFACAAGFETFVTAYTSGIGINLEPLGMFAMLGGLGYYVARRAFTAERRLVAISQELETARTIQQSILPRDVPPIGRVRIAVRYVPMSEVAGDVYDFIAQDGGIGVMVADVAGHGVPAAMVASMAKVALHAQREHLADPSRVLEGMNNALCGYFDRTYVTAAFAWLDAAGRRLVYANAGHPALIVRRANGRLERLAERGMVLGFMPDVAYGNASVDLQPRDTVLIVTDGILEAENAQGEFFGDARLDAVLSSDGVSGADELAGRIVAQLREWTARPESFADDVTLVVAEIA